MKKLEDNAITGEVKEKNPFGKKLEDTIAYDQYECDVTMLDNSGNKSFVEGAYKFGAKKVAKHIPSNSKNILDVGSGTGISTLEIFLRSPNAKITGVDVSKSNIFVSKYKFNQKKDESIKPYLNKVSYEVLNYWKDFRKQSKQYKEQVKFILGNFEKIDFKEKFDTITAVQSMHWLNLSNAFSKFYNLLNGKGKVFWDTASHFYDDKEFPAKEYGIRYNDFIGFVLDEVSKKFEITKDYNLVGIPKNNLESIKRVSSENGFKTKHLGTWRQPIDFRIFLTENVFPLVRTTINPESYGKKLDKTIQKSILKVMQNPDALKDNKHLYDIVPVFSSEKI